MEKVSWEGAPEHRKWQQFCARLKFGFRFGGRLPQDWGAAREDRFPFRILPLDAAALFASLAWAWGASGGRKHVSREPSGEDPGQGKRAWKGNPLGRRDATAKPSGLGFVPLTAACIRYGDRACRPQEQSASGPSFT